MSIERDKNQISLKVRSYRITKAILHVLRVFCLQYQMFYGCIMYLRHLCKNLWIHFQSSLGWIYCHEKHMHMYIISFKVSQMMLLKIKHLYFEMEILRNMQ